MQPGCHPLGVLCISFSLPFWILVMFTLFLLFSLTDQSCSRIWGRFWAIDNRPVFIWSIIFVYWSFKMNLKYDINGCIELGIWSQKWFIWRKQRTKLQRWNGWKGDGVYFDTLFTVAFIPLFAYRYSGFDFPYFIADPSSLFICEADAKGHATTSLLHALIPLIVSLHE